MAEFPDLLINPNPNAPTLDASGNQVRGINIFETTAERDALNATVRIPGALAIIKGSDELYQYTATTVDDTAWQNASNWLGIGSSGGGGGTEGQDLSFVVRDAPYTSDYDHEGTVFNFGLTGTLNFGVYQWSGTAWSVADAAGPTTAQGLLALGLNSDAFVLEKGIFSLTSSPPFSAGDVLYLGKSGNTITNDISGYTQGDIVRVIGVYLGQSGSVYKTYFDPSPDWIELA